MATITDDDQDSKIDTGYASGRGSYNATGLNDSEEAALGGIEDNYDKSADPRQENDNIAKTPSYINSVTGDKKTKEKFSIKNLAKKKGPVTFILGLIGIGGFGISTLLTPGLGLIQLKEILTGDLNDQLAAMDIRSDHVFRAKLKGMSSGVCSGVQIKCKFSSMSKRQVAKFEKAGFKVETEETALGRQRITALEAPDGTKIKNPAELTKARKSNPAVRSALNKTFNAKYYSLADKLANTVLAKNKTNKNKKISGNSVEERDKSLLAATAGENANETGKLVVSEEDGKKYAVGDNGAKYPEGSDEYKQIESKVNELGERVKSAKSTGVKATTGALKSGVKGLSVLGVADSACTVYNTTRAVSAAAKATRSIQLVQFAMVFLSTADAIKAGDATPEEVEYLGNMLTNVDTRKEVQSETEDKMVSNPFYGKSGFDSPGYKTAAYNEAPILTAQSQQYMVGGGLVGTLSGVLNAVYKVVPKSGIRNTCKTVQSVWGRGIGLIGGIVVAVGSFGVGTAISIAGSLAIGFALPFLESTLADIIAGTVITADTKGVEAGDAVFAGTGALLGNMAMARGMKPLDKSGIQSYIAATSDTKQSMIAAEQYEAQSTPFDIMNQYSFLGSVARSVNPFAVSLKNGGYLAATNGLFTTALKSVIPTSSAATQYNELRFSRCNDEGYSDLGIDADVFCNVRYGLSDEELNLDTDTVVNFMADNGHIDSETGAAKSKEYSNFLTHCTERDDGWGEIGEEGGSDGSECLADTFSGTPTKYFRVYMMDKSINDAMDDESDDNTNSSSTSTEPTATATIDIDMGELFKDSTSIGCADGTNDAGTETGYTNHKQIKIRVCELGNSTSSDRMSVNGHALVNSRTSGITYAMLEQMKKDLKLSSIPINSHFRTYAFQDHLYKTMPGKAAAPGTSNHQMGLAFDFGGGSCAYNRGITSCPSNKIWSWLNKNGNTYGFKQLSDEWWHWSPAEKY